MKKEEHAGPDGGLDCAARAIATGVDRIELVRMEQALRGLSTEQREVLLLVAVEQLSYAEVARSLAIPVCTMMSRLAHARERLRQMALAPIPV